MPTLESLHRRLVEEGPQHLLEQVLFLLLRGCAAIFGLGVYIRDLTFQLGLRKIYKSRLPVISVGNLAVGGTGKTPMVDLLIRHVLQQGFRVAVVSRGYGGKLSGDLGVVSLGDGLLLSPPEAGDEPCLLARRNPDAVVVVAPRRQKAVEYIERNRSADLIILDDAYQHRQVHRDCNILLLDVKHPFGNRQLLPAGLLREPESAISRADLICLTGMGETGGELSFRQPVVRAESVLSDRAISLDGQSRALCELSALKVVVFAGIARPERFFNGLTLSGIHPITCFPLGDHVCYDEKQIATIQGIAAAADADLLLTTEKDAVKLSAENFDIPCYSVGLETLIPEGDVLFKWVDQLLEKEHPMPLTNELLEILACPKCKGEVLLREEKTEESIICENCALAYPVRDGIPVMLIDEAAKLKY